MKKDGRRTQIHSGNHSGGNGLEEREIRSYRKKSTPDSKVKVSSMEVIWSWIFGFWFWFPLSICWQVGRLGSRNLFNKNTQKREKEERDEKREREPIIP